MSSSFLQNVCRIPKNLQPRLKELFISYEVVEGINDHKAVLLDLNENISKKVIAIGTKVRQYKKANVDGIHVFQGTIQPFSDNRGGMEEKLGAFKNKEDILDCRENGSTLNTDDRAKANA